MRSRPVISLLVAALGVALCATAAHAGQARFVHRASAPQGNLTIIDHSTTNDDWNALVFATPNWNPGGADAGVYVTSPIGVYVADQRWRVFNQNMAAMPLNAAFNLEVRNPDAQTFVHTATAANIASNVTFVDHPLANGRPGALLVVTPNWNPYGRAGVYENHHIGVFYDAFRGRWGIFNQDRVAMPVNAAFNVYVVPAASGFAHTATAATVTNNWTVLDDPRINNRPDAILQVTQLYDTATAVYNNHGIGVYYTRATGRWAIFNQDRAAMPLNAKFVVRPLSPVVYGDVVATGMEVTQSVQVYPAADANLIPLVGSKKTVVRVYLRSLEDAVGAFTDVTARLTVRGTDGRLIGRVLSPTTADGRGAVRVSPGGSNRDALGDSLNFVLELAQTAAGDRDFSVDVFTVSRRAESTTANNRLTVRRRFGEAIHRSLYGIAYGYSRNPDGTSTPAAPFSDFTAHRTYVENVLPLSSLSIVPLPGNPTFTVDNSDGGGYIRGHNEAHALMDAAFPGGGQLLAILQPDQAGYNGWCCSGNRTGNAALRLQNYRRDPGPTLAHELGHNWGRAHTFEDAAYPRDDESMGRQTNVRTNLGAAGVGLGVVAGSSAAAFRGDIMSYSDPFGISPYTYCGILSALTAGRLTCSNAARIAQTDAPRPAHAFPGRGRTAPCGARRALPGGRRYVYVSGFLDGQGKAELAPFEQIDSLDDLAQVTRTDGDYEITFTDAGGDVLATEFFAPAGADADEDDRRPFGLYLPWPDGTRRIVLSRHGKVLAKRVVSAHVPRVALRTTFRDGETLAGRRLLQWAATDADGDALHYSVDFSADGGATWMPVGMRLSKNALLVDFDSLPGTSDGRLRVLASDGVNTAEAISEATVRLADKAPRVQIAAPTDGARLVAGQTIIADAAAFDWEEGAVEDVDAYVWRSDRDGELGTGRWIALSDLSPGRHTLTVAVTDDEGLTGHASTTIEVAPR